MGAPASRATGLDAIDQYGRGAKDPDTGLWDWYDIPENDPARSGQGVAVSLADLLAQEDLIVCDFHEIYGVEVESSDMTWWSFRRRLWGLLWSERSRLRRHFLSLNNDDDEEPA